MTNNPKTSRAAQACDAAPVRTGKKARRKPSCERSAGAVRLADVAKLAGVSTGTASKVLNTGTDLDRLSADCIERVRNAARQLGYQRNYHASSLQTGKSLAVGLVLICSEEDYFSGFWGPLVHGMEFRAREAGYHFVIVGKQGGQGEVATGLRYLEERRRDGLLVPGYIARAQGCVEALEQCPRPVVMVEHEDKTSLPVIGIDDTAGFADAVTHLAQLGHRRLLWVGPHKDQDRYTRRRREAFWNAVENNGIQAEDLFIDDSSAPINDKIRLARNAIIGRYRSGCKATGIVCYMEPLAFGAYFGLAELGKRIPDDVSVIGFDDFKPDWVYPAMTEISLMFHDAGSRAAGLLLEMIDDPAAWKRLRGYCERLDSRLHVRASTGPVPPQR